MVDPQTPSLTPKLYQTRGGDIPYMYVDNAAKNVDVPMLFRCVVAILKAFVKSTKSGDDSMVMMGQKVAAAMDNARRLQVRKDRCKIEDQINRLASIL